MKSLKQLLAALAIVAALVWGDAPAAAERPNVLFIAVDDLRPELGAYSEDHMVTPHMDRLASEGRAFERHYVQAPSCGPSRYALLTGMHPTPAHPVSYANTAFRLYEESVGPLSLQQHFRDHGYHTTLIGKISHTPDGRRGGQDVRENREANEPEAPGWDVMDTPTGQWNDAWSAFFAYAFGETRTPGESPPVEAADVQDRGYPDAYLADAAIEHLVRRYASDEPFFLAVGFYKPHLPFNAPKKYWDLYDRDAIDISDVDPYVRTGGEFFGNYGHEASDTEDPAYVRELRHGYYASTSYVDAQIGRVLEAVDNLGMNENTIIVLWSDHGYHLGELGYWGKHTLHEHSLRVPFIIRAPDMPQPGAFTRALTATVDIYPTLAELCGLPLPDHLEGVSMAPLVEDPSAETVDRVYGGWSQGAQHTVRTDRWRLIENNGEARLYDHDTDPGEREDVAEERPEVVERLLEKLAAMPGQP